MSTYPAALDDLTPGNTTLDHGDVSDAVAAVQATLGVNPQGVAATVAARLAAIGSGAPGADGRTILSGEGAPASGDGFDDLDGISDPWRWAASAFGWAVTAYECTWADGDMLPHVDATGRGDADQIRVLVSTTFDTLAEVIELGGVAAARFSDVAADADPTEGDVFATLVGSGSGAVIVLQLEPGGGHTTAPEPSFDPTDPIFVGPLVLGAAITFSDTQTGVDGDFYIDTDATALYGPKDGTWPDPVPLIGPPGADAADPLIVTDPNDVQWRIVVDNTGALSTEAV